MIEENSSGLCFPLPKTSSLDQCRPPGLDQCPIDPGREKIHLTHYRILRMPFNMSDRILFTETDTSNTVKHVG